MCSLYYYPGQDDQGRFLTFLPFREDGTAMQWPPQPTTIETWSTRGVPITLLRKEMAWIHCKEELKSHPRSELRALNTREVEQQQRTDWNTRATPLIILLLCFHQEADMEVKIVYGGDTKMMRHVSCLDRQVPALPPPYLQLPLQAVLFEWRGPQHTNRSRG